MTAEMVEDAMWEISNPKYNTTALRWQKYRQGAVFLLMFKLNIRSVIFNWRRKHK